MSFFPADSKKIRARISSYERKLKSPNHRDGSGLRFLLGPLYLAAGDIEGAAKHYTWYKRKFPDDMPEAFNHLCWVLTLLRTGKEKKAVEKFRELVFGNLYLVPLLLKEHVERYPFRHSSNWEDMPYITEGPHDEIFPLGQPRELEWIRNEWRSKTIQDAVARFVEIEKKLDQLHTVAERSPLVDELYSIRYGRKIQPEPDNLDNVLDFSDFQKSKGRPKI